MLKWRGSGRERAEPVTDSFVRAFPDMDTPLDEAGWCSEGVMFCWTETGGRLVRPILDHAIS